MLKIINDSKADDFIKETIQQLTEEELFDFVLKNKHTLFIVFINDFVSYIKLDPKINSLINNKTITIKQTNGGLVFSFKNKNEQIPLDYLFDTFEDFTYTKNFPNIDYVINTTKTTISFEFSPLFNLN